MTIKFSGKGQRGDLLDPKNWFGDVVPGITDSALITKSVGGTVDGTFDVNNLMLLGTYTITFAGSLDTVGVGNCQGLMVCDDAVAVFAPTATLSDGHVLIVGNDDQGTLLAQGSGTTHSVLTSVNAQVGKQAAADGIVTIDDSVWTNSGHGAIGMHGAGTLNVVDNGLATFGAELDMASSTGSSGTMTIAGGGVVDVLGALKMGGASPAAYGTADISVAADSSLSVGLGLWVGSGSTLVIAGGTVNAGSIRLMAGGVVSGNGTLTDSGGTAIIDDGLIRAAGGTLAVAGNIQGTGTIALAADSTVTLTGQTIRPAVIDFIGPDATLALSHGASVGAAILDFAVGDIIAMGSIDAVSFNAASGVLSVSENGAKLSSLHLVGNYTGDIFSVQHAAGGSQVILHSAT